MRVVETGEPACPRPPIGEVLTLQDRLMAGFVLTLAASLEPRAIPRRDTRASAVPSSDHETDSHVDTEHNRHNRPDELKDLKSVVLGHEPWFVQRDVKVDYPKVARIRAID
jgi:hypothetical protein